MFGTYRAQRRIEKARRNGDTHLDLSGLALTAVPEEIGNLAHLTTLNLAHNRLTALPEAIGNLTNLITVNLMDNQLTVLPDAVGALTSLGTLNLLDNQLVALPTSIGNLTRLTTLDLTRSRLTVLPESIGQLTNLTRLLLRHNQLAMLPESMGNLTDLTWLDLGSNQLAALPPSIDRLTRLSWLNLSGNRLTVLPGSVGNLTRLTWLDLGSNQLAALPESIGNVSQLVWLDLERNQLTALPESVGHLTHLGTLYLGGNRLTGLPDSIGSLTSLARLDVSGNEGLASPPPAVVAQGVEAMLAFLRARKGQGERLWRSKLLVIGQGGAGKTSLVKALAGVAHDPKEPTTHGLRIGELTLGHPHEPDVDMRLSVWDFGGQEIYHSTHQFFLTDQSLFVLVWTARAGWEHGRLRYWLDLVAARAPGAPVILVATHTADRAADLPLGVLRMAFPQIVASVAVDNAARLGIDQMRALLAEHASRLPLMGAAWPATWLAATRACREATETYVRLVRFQEILAGAGVTDPAAQRGLTGALHQLGEILHYTDSSELADTVVLNPEWLNARISRILDCQEVADRSGLLLREDLNREWDDIDPALRHHFLQMMDRYDVSYQVDDKEAVGIVVDRLPWDPPDYHREWDQLARQGGQEIRLCYQIGGTVPPGIPTWFIARSHRFTTPRYRPWRTGALLAYSDGEHYGLVELDASTATVDLTVRGPRPAAFFSILDDGLNVTFARYPGLRITRWVPCPCQPGCPTLFDYHKLTQRLRRSMSTVECEDSYQRVDINHMLLGIAPTSRDRRPGMDSEDVHTRLDEVVRQLAGQTELLQRELMKIRGLYQVRCPSVFTLTPSRRRLPGTRSYTLRLYCEQPGAWHQLPDDEGCYTVRELDPWLRSAAPYLNRIWQALSGAAQLAVPVLGVAAPELHLRLKDDVAHMRKVLDQVEPSGATATAPVVGRGKDWAAPASRLGYDAEFRTIEQLLITLDPQRGWGRPVPDHDPGRTRPLPLP